MGKTCEICGTYEAKHQGALNMHKYHCKMKNNIQDSMKVVSRIDSETLVLEECKEHKNRLLNLKIPIENKAYQHGYMEVCTICQHLTK